LNKENIFVVTTKDYAKKTAKHLLELNKKNILAEPEGKNTGPCIYYGSKVISDLDSGAVVVVIPADHAIADTTKYLDTIKYAIKISSKKMPGEQYPLVTLGIKPTRPDTGYGYIKQKGEIFESGRFKTYRVSSFTEKPDLKSAKKYLKSGNYYWNSGIFIWKVSSILQQFYSFYPHWGKYDNYNFYDKQDLEKFYKKVEPGPVDKMILEKSKNTLVIPSEFGWSDIGTWQSLDQYMREDISENIIRGSVHTLDTEGSLIISNDKPIITIGIKDAVVVDSDKGILVINKNDSQLIKKVIEKLGS
jgi:mannose-1-phosphate guanylyltransferase